MQPDYDDDDTWSLLEEGKPLLGVAGASQSSRSGRCDQVQRRACPSCCSCIPARYVVVAMLFLAWFNLSSMRVNLSVALVEMDNSTATLHRQAKAFQWNHTQEGWILSAFFIGLIVSQIPSGWLASRFGGKWVLGISTLLSSVLTLLIPMATYHTVWALVGIRVVEGVVQPSSPKGSQEYEETYKEEWREVFTIAAEVYVFGALIYLILASGEKQPWAEGRRKRKDKV